MNVHCRRGHCGAALERPRVVQHSINGVESPMPAEKSLRCALDPVVLDKPKVVRRQPCHPGVRVNNGYRRL
jgi:hypothetical protein